MLSTRGSLINNLTLDYEHFMNNIKNAGEQLGHTENEMLEIVKKNHQAKKNWEKQQEEIAKAGPDYKDVLMQLGCKPHEIKNNLKLALQPKTSSQITYGKRKIPISVIEDGVERQAVIEQNIEIITLDGSDNEDTDKKKVDKNEE